MIQYNEGVWVPYPEALPIEIVVRDHRGNPLIEMSCPVIILTLEELSELWNAGYRAGMSDLGVETKLPAVDFETCIQSKGMQIKQ